ncbi:4957_t:CDS:2 [Entrophospora sp. SA101]|nr:4957_t:CDS:2 [Entrophospora sp. SA101]
MVLMDSLLYIVQDQYVSCKVVDEIRTSQINKARYNTSWNWNLNAASPQNIGCVYLYPYATNISKN